MYFERIRPSNQLDDVIEFFWVVKSDDPVPTQQKIIPDGFPEIIFHFGDPFRIKLQGSWEEQPRQLLAGQLTHHFYLENTGRAEILGVKLKPSGVTRLFDISMHTVTDQVVDLTRVIPGKLDSMFNALRATGEFEKRIEIVDTTFSALKPTTFQTTDIELAIKAIVDSRGQLPVTEICETIDINERQLERLFKKYVGLSPKFYARVIRFSHIFQLVDRKAMSWAQLGLEAGFYDQPHFIKDFRAFTGEDPSRYFFDEPNLANFFMKK